MAAKLIHIDDTNFIWERNFAGDPKKDIKFGDSRRKANLLIPDPTQAKELVKMGLNVKETKPRKDDDPETFVPEYYIQIIAGYRDRYGTPLKYPPEIYHITPDYEQILLDEETVSLLDTMRVKNVNAVLSMRENIQGGITVYVRKLYVEQDVDDDPYMAHYRKLRDQKKDEVPFD